MAQQFINTGSAINAQDGDAIREGMVKTEDNFNELYDLFPVVLFPHTSSANSPSEIVGGPNGENATLGVTGSVKVTEQINTPTIFLHPTNFNGSFLRNLSQSSPSKSNIFIYNPGGSKFWYFNVRYFESFNITSHLGMGKKFSTPVFTINGEAINNRYFLINGVGGYIIGGGTNSGNRVSVKINANTATKDFEVNGELSGSEYFSNLPTEDPGVAGQWFVTSSAEALNKPGFEVVCVSQG